MNDNNNLAQNIDTIRYSYDGFNNGSRLDLLSDGRFINENYVFGCTGGGEREKVFGTYKMDNINLKLSPKTIELTEYPIEYPFDRKSKPKTTNINYGVDSLKIKTEFQIVTWENNKYLLSSFYDYGWSLEKENDYIRFANHLNVGLEPSTNGMYLSKKSKDSIKSEFNLKQIPEKWQEFFLTQPISAKIKSFKKITDPYDNENYWWEIELDKGKNDKMNNRLSMTTKDDMIFLEIDSVLTNRSFGVYRLPDFDHKKYPIGTELRTKWK